MRATVPDPEPSVPRKASVLENWQPISLLGLPAWGAWISSAAFHTVVITGLLTVTFPPVAHVNPADAKSMPTVLKIGEKLYFVSEILPRPVAPLPPAPKPLAKSVKAPPAPAPEPAASAAQAPRVFAPPQVKRNLTSESTVIQPLSPPELLFPQNQVLPSFEIQAPRPLRITKQFVVPGQQNKRPVEAVKPLPAPPQIEMARAAPVVFAPRSTLVVPPAPPPIVDLQAPEVKPTAEPVARMGDPVSILSLSAVSAPPVAEIVVPPGNMIGRTGDAVVATAGTATAPPPPAEPPMERASGRPSAASSLPDASKTPPPAQVGTPATPPAQAPLGPNQFRKPNNGQFDAVVVQNTPIDQFPEGRALLTGRPIYSVYIAMGTAKDWTLYFSVAGSAQPQQTNTRTVEISATTPVLAPYPILLENPKITLPAFFRYVLVFGTVTADGRFQNLRVVRATRPDADKALLAALANWEFRPASKEGAKIAVEVLLHIPVDGL